MGLSDQLILNNLEQWLSADYTLGQKLRSSEVRELLRVILSTLAGAPQRFVLEGYGVTATGGMSVEVGTGTGLAPWTPIDDLGAPDSNNSPYAVVQNASVQSLVVTAADPVNPRIDIVILTPTRVLEGSSSRNIWNTITKVFDPTLVNKRRRISGVASIIAGTPAPSPVAPAVPAGAILISTISVGAAVASIVQGNIDMTVRSRAGVLHRDEDNHHRTGDPIEIDSYGPQVFKVVSGTNQIACVGFNLKTDLVSYNISTGVWTGTVKTGTTPNGVGAWLLAWGVPRTLGGTSFVQLVKWAEGATAAAGTVVWQTNNTATDAQQFIGSQLKALGVGFSGQSPLWQVEEFSDLAGVKAVAVTHRIRRGTLTEVSGNQFSAFVDTDTGWGGGAAQAGYAVVLKKQAGGSGRGYILFVQFAGTGSVGGTIIGRFGGDLQINQLSMAGGFSNLDNFFFCHVAANGTIRRSVNVTSVVVNGTGDYTVNLTNWSGASASVCPLPVVTVLGGAPRPFSARNALEGGAGAASVRILIGNAANTALESNEFVVLGVNFGANPTAINAN